MRPILVVSLASTLVLALPVPAPAQPRGPVKIDMVRFGLPTDNWENTPAFRVGAWMPVYVELTAGPQGLDKDPAWVFVETNDSDEINTSFAVPLPPAIQPKESFTVLAYTRPGNSQCDVTVSVRSGVSTRSDGSVRNDGQNICAPFKKTIQAMEPGEALYLTVGSRVDTLRSALRPQEASPDRDSIAKITDVRLLPEHWFGYAAVDLLILTTGGNRDFFTALMDDKNPAMERRRRALVEWIQRGGKAVISVGRNHDVLTAWTDLQQVLPATVRGTVQVPVIRPYGEMVGQGRWQALTIAPSKNNPRPAVEVVRLEPRPGPELTTLLQTNNAGGNPTTVPLVVQAAQGLGRVTMVAFDLDQQPFLGWKDQVNFWRALMPYAAASGPLPKAEAKELEPNGINAAPFQSYDQQRAYDILGRIQDRLEDYGDEVPVISFGWVALFIVVYILVVGPLDYWFLKKVVKRLELTWITFPTVVLTVSAVAYFAAYYIKGDELKINKVDVIDIDLEGKQTYGTTWFTLFSPRIQHYTVGVEPVAPAWVPELPGDRQGYPVVMSWMGRPDAGRPRGQGLFRRSYQYATNYAGSDARLRGVPTALYEVPIQVWSTKSFTATWQTATDPAQPLFTAKLHHPGGDQRQLTGQITSHLPMQLEDAVLIHGEQLIGGGDLKTAIRGVWKLGTLVQNTAVQIDSQDLQLQTQWFTPPSDDGTTGDYYWRGRRRGQAQTGETTTSLVKTALFFDLMKRHKVMSNRSLAYLDQSWRAEHNQDGAIIYGRLAPPVGPAEQITQDPVSPSRLWLGVLPGQGVNRPSLSGTLRQETYVRIFIPIDTKP